MAYLTSRLLLLSLAACGSVTVDESTTGTEPPAAEDPAAEAPATPETGVAFRFFTADAGGGPKNAFDVLDEAHLIANGSLDVAPGDYYFSVAYDLCRQGLPQGQYVPRQSAVACRAFTVGATGHIVNGAAATELEGVACPHVATSTANGLAVGLAPFELHAAACGVFLARVIPAGQPELAENAIASLVFTAPGGSGEVFPACGDGNLDADEQCDDGNEDDGDGCSAACVVEPDCQP